MGAYRQVGALRTWYDEAGQGLPLVLLHGGLCTNDTWAPQLTALAEAFHVWAPERQGHGHTEDLPGPLSYAGMAAHTIGFLEAVVAEPAHLVGWSDGGIIALLVALERPELVRKLVVIGANFDTDGTVPGMTEGLLATPPEAAELEMFRGLYEAESPDGPAHWPVLFGKFKAMLTAEPHIPVAELSRILAPTLVMAGDDDLVTHEHTIALFRALRTAELAIVPGTSHALPMEKPELVNQLLLAFLQQEPIPTLMPIHRAPAPSH